MRLLVLSVLLLAVGPANPGLAQNAGPDVGPDTGTPSVLGPIMPRSLPPPTPVAPDATGTPAIPPEPAPGPSMAAPEPDLGTVTAVPLPPPGAAPAPASMSGQGDGTAASSRPPGARMPTAGAPILDAPAGRANPLTPIPLALPHPAATPASLAASPGTSPARTPDQSPEQHPAQSSTAWPAPPLVSTRLPTPPLSAEASPADFLRAARGALAAGRNGEARAALEMAQTRLLDRSVDAGQESVPSHNLAVRQISDAITALASNDRMACLRYIEFASRTIGVPLD